MREIDLYFPSAYAHADWRVQRAERTQHLDAGSPLPRAGSSKSLLEPAAQPPVRDVTARTNASCLCELIVGSSWWNLNSFELGGVFSNKLRFLNRDGRFRGGGLFQ